MDSIQLIYFKQYFTRVITYSTKHAKAKIVIGSINWFKMYTTAIAK